MCTSAHLERCYNGWTQTIASDGPTCWGSAHPSTYSSADRVGFLHQLIAAISAFPVLSTWNHREEGIEPFPSLFTLLHLKKSLLAPHPPSSTVSHPVHPCPLIAQQQPVDIGTADPRSQAGRAWRSWAGRGWGQGKV